MIRAAVALALSVAAADAQAPRVAVVKVHEVLMNLDSTLLANEQTNARKAEINRDSRLATYNELYADLQLRRKALEESAGKIDPEARKRLMREYTVKLQEAKSVWDDFESFRSERMREIDGEMVAGMKQRLAQIREAANKLAKEEGYDWVLDTSGNSNTGVPLILYAKNQNDLTDRVLAILASEPPAPTPAPNPPAAQ
ncbi:OmpH family outer membrane protein [Luteolibacter flavescens]|uniref:OmpH family outer membrane protein n=1 Tax=Luteolibacter flavescens TaxID=1859460 RepID=A0ABT3FIV2_9BACT|nr:OmpH family outer membrane protein [Luteolibacter flavescens]MCW1883502.1 OmpH family outer membrane protein [Luteolibacter flavescens]